MVIIYVSIIKKAAANKSIYTSRANAAQYQHQLRYSALFRLTQRSCTFIITSSFVFQIGSSLG
jgi:hypothetical protein